MLVAISHEPHCGPGGWSCARCGHRLTHGRRGAQRCPVPQVRDEATRAEQAELALWATRARMAPGIGRDALRAAVLANLGPWLAGLGQALRAPAGPPGRELCVCCGKSAPSMVTLERHPCVPSATAHPPRAHRLPVQTIRDPSK